MNKKREDSEKPSKSKKLKKSVDDRKSNEEKGSSKSEFPIPTPSCSRTSAENSFETFDAEDIKKITMRMNSILDRCFKDKSEIMVNRNIFEELVSETLEGYCNKNEPLSYVNEVKQWTEKCKTLQAEQIRLNRLHYAFRKQVEDAKHITKKLIDEQTMFKKGHRRLNTLSVRKVRSVGVQVCTEGPMSVAYYPYKGTRKGTTQHFISYNSQESSDDEESSERYIPENTSAGVGTSIGVGTSSDDKSSSVENDKCVNPSTTSEKSSLKEISSDILVKSKIDDVTKLPQKLEVAMKEPIDIEQKKEVKKLQTQEAKKVPEEVVVKKEMDESMIIDEPTNLDIKELPGETDIPRKIKVEPDEAFEDEVNDVEVETDITIVEDIKVENNIAVKEEMVDEEYEEDIKPKDYGSSSSVVKDVKVSTHNEIPSGSDITKTGPSPGVGSFNIKIRSPDNINEHFSKQAQTRAPNNSGPSGQISLCNLPKYPVSPRYPASIPKPPAPILQVARKNTCGKLGVMLSWSFTCKSKPQNIVEYELYAYHESIHDKTKKDTWKKVGNIEALPLPMACFLTQILDDHTYHFIIRAVDNLSRIGDFSIPASIVLPKTEN